ncbi:IS30 family transposase [Bengtsoniella intestinalis]|uniref:IS30 family transposase n=1 Tax=Bengtsoniella intestinalis TaxID=3073143 RepID=UPI00391EE386
MNHYQHLNIEERENLLLFLYEKKSLRFIAQAMGRNVSTISREVKRNRNQNTKEYSAVKAEQKYHVRRKKCRRHAKLDNPIVYKKIKELFIEKQWSPEEIQNRLFFENSPIQISYTTIYRAIYAGKYDTLQEKRSKGNKGAKRHLRHKGKPRGQKPRGKVVISNHLDQRPDAANKRRRLGDFEADTVAGKKGGACLLTLNDRLSRIVFIAKCQRKIAAEVAENMIAIFSKLPPEMRHTITPDRGVEFTDHADVTAALGMEFYFPKPHAPWERGTNENSNGLIREYIPKRSDIAPLSDAFIQDVAYKLNTRPRKCLGWKTPLEVFYNKVLHLT